MDEKIAEVANLTLRLREMSGRVMWFENLQSEKAMETEDLHRTINDLQTKVASPVLSTEVAPSLLPHPRKPLPLPLTCIRCLHKQWSSGKPQIQFWLSCVIKTTASFDQAFLQQLFWRGGFLRSRLSDPKAGSLYLTLRPIVQAGKENAELLKERDQLMQEKDELLDQVKQLKAGDLLSEELSERSRAILESQGTNRGSYETGGADRLSYDDLARLLVQRNAEILSLKVHISTDLQHVKMYLYKDSANASKPWQNCNPSLSPIRQTLPCLSNKMTPLTHWQIGLTKCTYCSRYNVIIAIRNAWIFCFRTFYSLHFL